MGNPNEGVAIYVHIGETFTTATVAYYFSIASQQWVVKINAYIHKLDLVDYNVCGSAFLLEQHKDNVHTSKEGTFCFLRTPRGLTQIIVVLIYFFYTSLSIFR